MLFPFRIFTLCKKLHPNRVGAAGVNDGLSLRGPHRASDSKDGGIVHRAIESGTLVVRAEHVTGIIPHKFHTVVLGR